MTRTASCSKLQLFPAAIEHTAASNGRLDSWLDLVNRRDFVSWEKRKARRAKEKPDALLIQVT